MKRLKITIVLLFTTSFYMNAQVHENIKTQSSIENLSITYEIPIFNVTPEDVQKYAESVKESRPIRFAYPIDT